MGEFSIAVEHVGVGIHLLRCAGDLDHDGSAHLAGLVDHIPGLVHAVVDLGNVRSYAAGTLEPLHDDRITVIGVDSHRALLPGQVAAQLAALRSARDVDDALTQLLVDRSLRTTVIRGRRLPSATIPHPRDPRRGGVSTSV
jgi:hypothetical protein